MILIESFKARCIKSILFRITEDYLLQWQMFVYPHGIIVKTDKTSIAIATLIWFVNVITQPYWNYTVKMRKYVFINNFSLRSVSSSFSVWCVNKKSSYHLATTGEATVRNERGDRSFNLCRNFIVCCVSFLLILKIIDKESDSARAVSRQYSVTVTLWLSVTLFFSFYFRSDFLVS